VNTLHTSSGFMNPDHSPSFKFVVTYFPRDGLYQQAYTYMLNAEKFQLKELFVEKAKLYWEKGEQDPAFFTLRRGLEEHFPNVENSDSSSTITHRDDTKIYAEVIRWAGMLCACFM
jgi:hypothetical protein